MEIKTFLNKFEGVQFSNYGVKLPRFAPPEKHYKELGLDKDTSNYEFLRKLCLQGFTKLKLDKDSPKYKEYADRVKHELETIQELGFVDYILLVWDVINFCKENDIAVGPARGSAAGSLVLHLIGVTKIDPIPYNLYFERFISKTRAKKQVVDGITYLDGKLMCDIDVDICYYNRKKVVEYLKEKFNGRISQILTTNTLSGKLLIKECGKIVGDKTEEEVKAVANMIPKQFGHVRDIEETHDGLMKDGKMKLEPVEVFVNWCRDNREIYEIALKLRDLIKNKSVHASGLLLSCDPLDESVPQEITYDKEGNKVLVASYTMEWTSLINIKLDILGNKSVSVVDDICKQLKISADDINPNDPFIYKHLNDLRTPHGIFQLEAETNLKVCQKVKPRNVEELSGVLALARPGALIFVSEYADYINSGVAGSIHPFFDDILGVTGGVCIYQEQLMRMVNKIGFTLDESELVRRVVGKKKVEEMAEWEDKVDKKIRGQKLDTDIGKVLWRVMDASKDYSFNKSHSLAYASLAAITVYLKFKHPKEFYLSLLKMTKHESKPLEEISKIYPELVYFGVQLLPPHILKSEMDFTMEGDNIRYGLLSIKGIGDSVIQKLNNFRNKYANKFEVFQAAKDAELSIGTLSVLIQAGALEDYKSSRAWTVLEAQLWWLLTDTEKRYALQYGEKFNYNLHKVVGYLRTLQNDKGKPVIPDKRYGTIRRNYSPFRAIWEKNCGANERFANWYYEKTLLGYSYHSRMVDVFREQFDKLIPISEIQDLPTNRKVSFVGTVAHVASGKSKKETNWVRFRIEDELEGYNTLIFNDTIENVILSNGSLPVKGNIVVVEGKKGEDSVMAWNVRVQDAKIYMRLAELKKENNNEEIDEEIVEEIVSPK